MRFVVSQRGQALLELAIVFPVIVGFILTTVVAADRFGLRLAVHWAARHAARAEAVNPLDESCMAARAAASQSLAPWHLRILEVTCATRRERPASKPRMQVRIEAHGRGRAVAQAEFPVMYAPR